jgi:signal transduction histidine kinase
VAVEERARALFGNGAAMDDQQTAPRESVGLGLRAKLALGFAVLLAILIFVSAESIELLDRLGGSIDVILRENYRSVIACEEMKESLERLDSGALFALAGEAEQGRALAAQHRPRFEAALRTEVGNITLPGESERAGRLRQLFAAYGPVLERVLAPEIPQAARRSLYFQTLYPTFLEIKGAADAILQMNQKNMVEANDRARAQAAAAIWRMALLLLVGTAFAGACVAFLSRSILGPLERLTWAARRIQSGQLDLTVPVASGDELGQLGAAFNAMAGGLRELRESDQASLWRSRSVSQAAVDELTAALAVISTDRQIELANLAASSLLGLEPGAPLPERHAAWLKPLLDRAETGHRIHPDAAEPVRLTIDGEVRRLAPRASLLNQEGRAAGFVLIAEDVTDVDHGRRLRESQMAGVARDLARIERPLSALLEALAADPEKLPPELREGLAAARGGVARLVAVAANLAASSGLEESRQRLRPQPVAPAVLLEAAVRDVRTGYADDRIELVTHVDPEAPRVLADGERAGLLLVSLLRQARSRTPVGGSVRLTAARSNGWVRFEVGDDGGGIPAPHLARLFEPFYEAPGTRDVGDLGLSLAMAREIVQAHGGEMHVESEEERGTTVWFTLPAEQ